MNESLLAFRGFLYLKVTVGLGVVVLALYMADTPLGGVPNGGTWLGYALGTVAALLILWLFWFGVRKRHYGVGRMPLVGWLSAHVYFGSLLLLIGTLHTGFHFGWNVHTLAYALMVVVIFSGMFGTYAYLRYPSLMTANRSGMTLDQLIAAIGTIDAQCREAALPLPDDINRLLVSACDNVIVGTLWQRLSGRVRGCSTEFALATLSGSGTSGTGRSMQEMEGVRSLVGLLSRKADLLRRARADIRFKALLEIWLYLHVPLSVALLAALIAHVVSVFYFW
ncbi:MAG: hypothetical protein HYR63_23005 [Proteobacteria bacterium]|nr:hypothetical protein [Pseudomonadota bacterium]